MPLYRYRAINGEGNISQGHLEALNEFDLQAQLGKTGLDLLQADQVRSDIRRVHKLNRRDLITFIFHMEMLLRAGVPILSIISDLRGMAKTHQLSNLCGVLYEKIDVGSTISEAFASTGAFPEITVNLVRAGEATGELPEVLKRIGKTLRWEDELSSKTKQILIYPAFVSLVISGTLVFLMTFIVPKLMKFILSMGHKIPLHTKILIWVSNAFVHYWWLIIPLPPALVLVVFLVSKINHRLKRLLHAVMLRIPVIGPVVQNIILSRVCDTLALTYETGIAILEGLLYCRDVSGNLIIKEAVEKARISIINGTPISQGFGAQQIFPPLVIRMLKVGEDTGDLAGALKNISYFFNRDIDESIGRVQAMIEPFLTVVLGGTLGWIMMAVLGPIYDTISRIKIHS